MIERWHQSLRRELLDAAGPFADVAAAQAAINAWVEGYNRSRPHQSLAMATPASVFRPAPVEPAPSRPPLEVTGTVTALAVSTPAAGPTALPAPPEVPVADRDVPAVEWEAVSCSRASSSAPPSRFSTLDLRDLRLRGDRIVGPEPGPAALPAGPMPPTSVIECDRTVSRDGTVGLGDQRLMLDPPLAGQRVALRFKSQLLQSSPRACS